MQDCFVPLSVASATMEVKGSVFTARLSPARSQEEAAEAVALMRSDHRKSSHVAWAWSVPGASRSSDDGEPSGTAGRPAAAALANAGINCAVIAVARYFGGVKLGAPGLTRAYAGVAAMAVSAASLAAVREMTGCGCVFAYPCLEPVTRTLALAGALVTGQEFGGSVSMSFAVSRGLEDAVKKQLGDACAGQIRFGEDSPVTVAVPLDGGGACWIF